MAKRLADSVDIAQSSIIVGENKSTVICFYFHRLKCVEYQATVIAHPCRQVSAGSKSVSTREITTLHLYMNRVELWYGAKVGLKLLIGHVLFIIVKNIPECIEPY